MKSRASSRDLNAEEVVEFAKVLDGEACREIVDAGSDERGGASCDQHVINIDKYVDMVFAYMSREEGGVCDAVGESEFKKMVSEFHIPCSWSLTETIESFC